MTMRALLSSCQTERCSCGQGGQQMEALGGNPDSKCDCALEHDIDKNCQVTLSWNTNRIKATRKKCAEPC